MAWHQIDDKLLSEPMHRQIYAALGGDDLKQHKMQNNIKSQSMFKSFKYCFHNQLHY